MKRALASESVALEACENFSASVRKILARKGVSDFATCSLSQRRSSVFVAVARRREFLGVPSQGDTYVFTHTRGGGKRGREGRRGVAREPQLLGFKQRHTQAGVDESWQRFTR